MSFRHPTPVGIFCLVAGLGASWSYARTCGASGLADCLACLANLILATGATMLTASAFFWVAVAAATRRSLARGWTLVGACLTTLVGLGCVVVYLGVTQDFQRGDLIGYTRGVPDSAQRWKMLAEEVFNEGIR